MLDYLSSPFVRRLILFPRDLSYLFLAPRLFFCRYNKVLLDKTSLERRLKSLKTENDRLRKGLQQFCDGVSVTDSVMKDSTNPLLVINGRRQQHMRATVDLQLKPPPNTKIEAAHIVKNMAQLYQ